MKKILPSVAVFAGILFFAGLYFYETATNPNKKEKKYLQKEGSHNPESAHYLWRLLHDPATGKIPENIRHEELEFAASLPKIPNNKSLSWTALGPYNVGGRTRGIDIDANNDSIMVAGGVSGGIWRTTDAGASWSKVTHLQTQLSITCIAQDKRPGHRNIWYAGSGEAYGQSASATGAYYLGNGLYKSTDDGQTWQSISGTNSNHPYQFISAWQIIWNVTVDPNPADSGRLYAATYGAVRVSDNGGNTFPHVLNAGNAYFTDVAVTSTGVAYATFSSDGSKKGIWRSTDGVNWTDITPNSFPTTFNRIVIGINPQNENDVYFLANTPGAGKVVTTYVNTLEGNSLWKYRYLSGSGADSSGLSQWTNLSDNLPDTGAVTDHFYVQGSYDMVVAVDPSDSNTVFIGGTNLYRSTDGFTSDSNTTQIGGYAKGAGFPTYNMYPDHHPDQHNLIFPTNQPNTMISTCDGGIFKTTNNLADTVVWESLNNGYRTTQFYTIAIDPATPGSNIIMGGLQDNSTYWTNSANPTTPWTMPGFGDGSFCAVTNGAGMYYLSMQNGKTYKVSLNSSGIRTGFRRIDPIGGKGYNFVNPFVLDPNNNNIMYMPAGRKLWRNDSLNAIPLSNQFDSISTGWFEFPDSLTDTTEFFTAIAISKTPANIAYLGTNKGNVYKVTNANNSSTYTFTQVDTNNTLVGGNINCIAVDPKNANNVIAVYSNYSIYSLYNSTDGGNTWHKCGGNLETNQTGIGGGPSMRWINIMHIDTNTAYLLGTSIGLYATDTLRGLQTHWRQLGANTIGNAVVDMIKSRASDGLVVVATHGNGIYTTHLTDISDVHDTTLSINNIQLEKLGFNLYPNPARNDINLALNLKNNIPVNIKIYDLTGKVVKIIHKSNLVVGRQKINISLNGLSKGTYIISIYNSYFKESCTFVKI